jgi:hypothetical protein
MLYKDHLFEGKNFRWKNYIKIDIKQIKYNDVDWIQLAQDRVLVERILWTR